MMCKHICSQMNVAIAAMIAGCLRHRRRDHAITRIHDRLLCDDWLDRYGGGSVRVETKSRRHQQCIRAAVV